jgi:hypothetical protein
VQPVEAAVVVHGALVQAPELAQERDQLSIRTAGASPLTLSQFSVMPLVPLPRPSTIRPSVSSSRSRASGAQISGERPAPSAMVEPIAMRSVAAPRTAIDTVAERL